MHEKSLGEAEGFVLQFLRLMERRQLEAAEAMLAPGARIEFPGRRRFQSQGEMVSAARGRYQWVKKTFERVDLISQGDLVVVYVLGSLHGVNRHGVPFEGVRYIDRFEVQGGRIISQEVWNDLAETGVLERTEGHDRPAT